MGANYLLTNKTRRIHVSGNGNWKSPWSIPIGEIMDELCWSEADEIYAYEYDIYQLERDWEWEIVGTLHDSDELFPPSESYEEMRWT